MGCPCNRITAISNECNSCNEECPYGNIGSECIVVDVDLPNLGTSANEGLSEVLQAFDDNLNTTIKEGSITIPTASVKALFTTPYTIINAPGSGKYIEVLSLEFRVSGGTVIYTVTGGTLRVKSLNSTNYFMSVSDSVLTSTNSSIISKPAHSTLADGLRSNDPIVVTHSASDPTGGNGALVVYFTYIIKTQ